jgi:hypothetical protein
MTKNLPLLEHVSLSGVETISLNYREITDILGLQLPKTTLNCRVFWNNSKNKSRIQSLLGLSSSYTCRVKLEKRIVIFQKKR